MFFINRSSKTLKTLTFTGKDVSFGLSHPTQTRGYVDVYMKWKRYQFFESIEHIHRSTQLKSVIALKNRTARDSDGCIPISSVSKRGREFDVPTKVTMFLRRSIFEEFTGPSYNLPWFRLTPAAVEIDREEKRVYQNSVGDLRDKLKRLILMSKDKALSSSVVHGMRWNLGLPDDFMEFPEINLDSSFRLVDLEDGSKGLGVELNGENRVLSVLQRNAMKRGLYSGESYEAIGFPLFPSKGLRLRRKIEDWLKEFQELPYLSPYSDYSDLDPDSDVAEKRVIGFLHKLLCLFVEHSGERKWFGLPHVFHLSPRKKTCTAILKEAYKDKSSVESHPLLPVRKEYIHLMRASEAILKSRRIEKFRQSSRTYMFTRLYSTHQVDEEGSEANECDTANPSSGSTNVAAPSTGMKEMDVKHKVLSNLKVNPRHDFMMIFTCRVCETRSVKMASRESYEKGIVVARCAGCNNLHLIADRLGWFGEPGSVEDFLAARGEDIKRESMESLNLTLEDLAGKKSADE